MRLFHLYSVSLLTLKNSKFYIYNFLNNSGVMIVFQQFNLLKQNEGKFNYFTFLLKPWLHLCVLMTGAMMTIYLLPLFGSGPLWHITDNILAVSCKQVNKLAPSFLMYSNWIGPLTDYQVGITVEFGSWMSCSCPFFNFFLFTVQS